MKRLVTDEEALQPYASNFCVNCGRHWGWHGPNGECPKPDAKTTFEGGFNPISGKPVRG